MAIWEKKPWTGREPKLIVESTFMIVRLPMEPEAAQSLEQDGVIVKSASNEYQVTAGPHSRRNAERLMFLALYAREKE